MGNIVFAGAMAHVLDLDHHRRASVLAAR